MHTFPSSACHCLKGQGVFVAAQVETTCRAAREESCPGKDSLLVDVEQRGQKKAL